MQKRPKPSNTKETEQFAKETEQFAKESEIEQCKRDRAI